MKAEEVGDETPAVVIGTGMMGGNLLLFDVDMDRFVFSGELWGWRTSCGNLNFTWENCSHSTP